MTLEEYRASVLRLYPLIGYFERYFELLPDYRSGFEAYEAIEREFFKVFNCNRYSSYDSFRISKRRYIHGLSKSKR